MMEEWRQVEGCEGRYEVSNLGCIRSLRRRRAAGCILKPFLDGGDYPSVSIRINGKRRAIRVHRIVAKAFLPEPALFQVQVAHLDGSRTNNVATNLKWACNAENSDHKRFHGTHQSGEAHPRAKLTAEQVACIRRSTERHSALARRYNVNPSAIRKIRTGERWRQASQSGPLAASPNLWRS